MFGALVFKVVLFIRELQTRIENTTILLFFSDKGLYGELI